MSRLRHKRFSLGIGADDMSVVDAANMRLLTSLPLATYLPGAESPATADWAPSIEAVLAQADVPAGGDLLITVSDAWVRYFMLTIPDGVSSLEELRMLAAGRFETLFSATTDGWTLAADWKASGKILVCALPSRLVEVSQMVSESTNWRVRSIQPFALRLQSQFAAQIPDECWLCCFLSSGMVAMLITQGTISHVRRFAFRLPPASDVLYGMLEAEILRLGLSMPEQVCVLGMLPDLPESGKFGKAKLVRAQGTKVLHARPGQTAESVSLAIQGVYA